MEHWIPESQRWIESQAKAAGFDAAGLVSFAPPDGQTEDQRFVRWIESGRAGQMEYLKRRDPNGRLVRSAPSIPFPWARSALVCALNYNAPAPFSTHPAPTGSGWIARYAWSGRSAPDSPDLLAPTDYHNELLHRLRLVEAQIQQRFPCETRSYVDTGPLLERDLAARAGIGWIGKNTCVLNQQLGSWLLLGVILTSIPVAHETPLRLAEDRCGSCTRCLDACPTQALTAPRQMDASLCIAYLTIEKKGDIPEPLRSPMGRQIFGCDICQDVCPWNRKAPISTHSGMTPRPSLINPSLDWLASLDNPAFKRHFRGSPLERTGRKRLHRNVAIAMGNSRNLRFLPRLRIWAASDDPVLSEAALWSIRQIESYSSADPVHALPGDLLA